MPLFLLLACSGTNDNAYTLPPVDSVTVQQKSDGKAEKTQVADTTYPPGGAELPVGIEGPKVTFEGRVEYSGSKTGTIEVEVLQNTLNQSVSLIAQVTLSELGDFKIEVPSRPNELTVMAYLDLTGDRISDDDPRGYLQVPNSLEEQKGFVVTILELEELEKVKDQEDKKDAEKSEK